MFEYFMLRLKKIRIQTLVFAVPSFPLLVVGAKQYIIQVKKKCNHSIYCNHLRNVNPE